MSLIRLMSTPPNPKGALRERMPARGQGYVTEVAWISPALDSWGPGGRDDVRVQEYQC